MFDVGGGELILIVLAIIVLFGPKKIPEIAQMLGKGMRQFRVAQTEFKEQINSVKQEVKTNIDNIKKEVKSIDSAVNSNTTNQNVNYSSPEGSVKLPNSFKPINTNLQDEIVD